jgi:hypothetical protein
MKIIFFENRKKVGVVNASSMQMAISWADKNCPEWTRYKFAKIEIK